MSENEIDLTKVADMSAELKLKKPILMMIDALIGGTEAMRLAGSAYLYKFKSETEDDFLNRVQESTLMPTLKETIEDMVGRIFGKNIDLEQVSKWLDSEYLNNFDGEGNNLLRFIEKITYSALAYGATYCITDSNADGRKKSIDEAKRLGERPYAICVQLPSILDIRYKRVNGVERITTFRYIHSVEDESNSDIFTQKYQEEVVHYYDGLVATYRKGSDGNWVYHKPPRKIIIDGEEIDYAPIEELKLSRKPPFLDLAYLNVKHWQSQSSQDNIINTARVPILLGINTDFKADKPLFLNGLVQTNKQNSDMKYVQLDESSINVGQESLKEIEKQMEFAGAKVLTKTVMALTETQAGTEAKERVSELMLYATMIDGFIYRMLKSFSKWVGKKDGDEIGSLNIADNIDDKVYNDSSLAEIVGAVQANFISKKTAFETIVARNIVPSERVWDGKDGEKERIEAERLTMDDGFDVDKYDD